MWRMPIALMLLAGCYRTVRDPELTARLQKAEARIAELEKRPDPTHVAMTTAELEIHIRNLIQKNELLTKEVEFLETKLMNQVAAQPPPPPPRRRTPDPAAIYAVPVGASPTMGSPKAKVTIVMAFEFACPFCNKAWGTIDDLAKKYGKDLRIVYKQYVVHPTQATAAAQLSCAAARQGRWRQTADLLWDKAFLARQFDQANIDAIALEAGLDVKAYQADATGPCVQILKDDQEMLTKVGVTGTPTFYINGRHLSGARPPEEFVKLIDEELAKATALVKKGVKPDKLYDQEIVAKGLTEIPLP